MPEALQNLVSVDLGYGDLQLEADLVLKGYARSADEYDLYVEAVDERHAAGLSRSPVRFI